MQNWNALHYLPSSFQIWTKSVCSKVRPKPVAVWYILCQQHIWCRVLLFVLLASGIVHKGMDYPSRSSKKSLPCYFVPAFIGWYWNIQALCNWKGSYLAVRSSGSKSAIISKLVDRPDLCCTLPRSGYFHNFRVQRFLEVRFPATQENLVFHKTCKEFQECHGFCSLIGYRTVACQYVIIQLSIFSWFSG